MKLGSSLRPHACSRRIWFSKMRRSSSSNAPNFNSLSLIFFFFSSFFEFLAPGTKRASMRVMARSLMNSMSSFSYLCTNPIAASKIKIRIILNNDISRFTRVVELEDELFVPLSRMH